MAQPPALLWELPRATLKIKRHWLVLCSRACLALVLLALWGWLHRAQSPASGSVGGTVVDAFGGLVMGARVEARNRARAGFAGLAPISRAISLCCPGCGRLSGRGERSGICARARTARWQWALVTECTSACTPADLTKPSRWSPKVQELDTTSSAVAANVDQASWKAAVQWPPLVRLRAC